MAQNKVNAYGLDGTLRYVFQDFVRLDYGCGENKPGALELIISDDGSFKPSDWTLDMAFCVFRKVGGYPWYLEGERAYLLREWVYETDSRYQKIIRLRCTDAMEILSRRIIAYTAGTAYTNKTAMCDDMIKALWRENLGALATDATRSIAAYVGIQADTGAAPSTTKEFSNRNVLTTSQELAKDSFSLGTYMAFDVVWLGSGGATVMEARTYATQRGTDRRAGTIAPITVSEATGTLDGAKLDYNFSNEVTFQYAGGRGEGVNRMIVSTSDAARMAASALNRVEGWVDARNSESTASVTSEAQSALKKNRATVGITGRLVDTDAIQYGVSYNYGDYITAVHKGISVDCHVDTVKCIVEKGNEKLTISVKGETIP
jgi:hypothetical protein